MLATGLQFLSGSNSKMPSIAQVLLACGIVFYFAAMCCWKGPRTDAGKLALRLLGMNGVGWLGVVLTAHESGHPPLSVCIVMILLPLSVILLPAAGAALAAGKRDSDESRGFLILGWAYLFGNVAVAIGMVLASALLA